MHVLDKIELLLEQQNPKMKDLLLGLEYLTLMYPYVTKAELMWSVYYDNKHQLKSKYFKLTGLPRPRADCYYCQATYVLVDKPGIISFCGGGECGEVCPGGAGGCWSRHCTSEGSAFLDRHVDGGFNMKHSTAQVSTHFKETTIRVLAAIERHNKRTFSDFVKSLFKSK